MALEPIDDTEYVRVTRAMLISGMLVGTGGESDPVPSQAQLDRAADLIIRAARRREIDQGLNRLIDRILER